MLNIEAIRSQFPILAVKAHGQRLVYLDNAATTQKPLRVLGASRAYYETANANVHRGAHYLSGLATEAHERARRTAADFLRAPSPNGIIFTSGCTMGINLAAQTLAAWKGVRRGDEVIISADSHHSNIVPWQILCERRGLTLRVVPLTEELTFDEDAFTAMLSAKTKVVALPLISNALGLVNPLKRAFAAAKRANPRAVTLADGAQAAASMPVDVQELGCDFYAFSGHKMYAPMGTGVLWGREELLEELPPWLAGGEMIREVTFEKTTFNALPFKYEAGTPDVEGAVALAAAMDFMREIGMQNIHGHEAALTAALFDGLSALPGVRVLGPRAPRGPLVSIAAQHAHPYDIGALLDQMGIAVRTGHHCCQPLMQRLGITGTTRFSLGVYNTEEDVRAALSGTERALAMLA